MVRLLRRGPALARSVLALALALGTAAPALAQTSPQPRLVVLVAVDQLSSDLFEEYRPLFGKGMRTIQSGVVFPSAYQGHAATETCPGHATMLTGARPARSGIIANFWVDPKLPRADKNVYCAEDPTVPGSASGAGKFRLSPQFLRVPTLGERMKAVDPRSRSVIVSGKDRAVVMLGGRSIDQGWFWGNGAFETLPGRAGPAPSAVQRASLAAAKVVAAGNPADLPDLCRARVAPLKVGDNMIGVPRPRAPGDLPGYRNTTLFDASVTDLAIGLLDEMKLGRGAATDLLAVSLSATDHIGHVFGTQGPEMCAQMLALDANIGRLVAALDATRVPYMLVLTSDHGGLDTPERLVEHGIRDAARVDPELTVDAVGKAVATELELPGPVLYGRVTIYGDIYAAPTLSPADRARVLAAARARYLAHPQVQAVFTADELRAMPMPGRNVEEWTLAERFRASFDPDRSGDLVVALKPHVMPIPRPRLGITGHGSPWNYDRRVPLIVYAPGIKGFEQPLPVETVEILPTIASRIGLAVPGTEIDGRCLDLDAGATDSCAAEPARR